MQKECTGVPKPETSNGKHLPRTPRSTQFPDDVTGQSSNTEMKHLFSRSNTITSSRPRFQRDFSTWKECAERASLCARDQPRSSTCHCPHHGALFRQCSSDARATCTQTSGAPPSFPFCPRSSSRGGGLPHTQARTSEKYSIRFRCRTSFTRAPLRHTNSKMTPDPPPHRPTPPPGHLAYPPAQTTHTRTHPPTKNRRLRTNG